ncbi:MAG: ATP-grasp domain-containing protein [Sinobacteraceae bacterium]|nr:ATP-grasp domain-containing protein [Nevskiaceae bacterium]
MSETVLLTLGRLPKALEIARALAAAGCRVVVAEPFKRHLTGASRAVARSVVVHSPVDDHERYLTDMQRVIEEEGVGLVVPVSEEILFAAALRDRLPDSVRVFSMPFATLRALHDKYSFIGVCAAAGVAAPQTRALDSPDAQALADACPTVVKPVASCSGRGVQFLERGARLPSVTEPCIVQEFCAGQLLSTFSVARHGQVLLTVTYRGAVMQGTVAVCFERIDTPPPVAQWVERFVGHCGFDGFISFDLVQQAEGLVHGIECNPRATSGIHFVDPEGLATAILHPEQPSTLRYREERLLQQFYPCLTETQKSMFTERFAHNFRCLRRARDVTWSLSDPWPWLSMPLSSWTIIEQALRRGCTFGEVAMLDMAWTGGPLREGQPRVAAAQTPDVK